MLLTGVCRIAAFCAKSSISFNFRSGLDFLCEVQCFGVLYCLVLGIGPENQQQVVHVHYQAQAALSCVIIQLLCFLRFDKRTQAKQTHKFAFLFPKWRPAPVAALRWFASVTCCCCCCFCLVESESHWPPQGTHPH